MSKKKYLDLVGLGKFKNKLVTAFAQNTETEINGLFPSE